MKNRPMRFNPWFLLSALSLLRALWSLWAGRGVVVVSFDGFAVALFAALGIAQNLCDAKGDAGKRAMGWIGLAAALLIVLVAAALLLPSR